MGSKNEAIGMKIGMDLTSIDADGVALSDFNLQTNNKRSGTRRYFKDDCGLGTSEAALDAFSMMTVSLVQAKRHSMLFQRLRCP